VDGPFSWDGRNNKCLPGQKLGRNPNIHLPLLTHDPEYSSMASKPDFYVSVVDFEVFKI
jgi:hypothetical protein